MYVYVGMTLPRTFTCFYTRQTSVEKGIFLDASFHDTYCVIDAYYRLLTLMAQLCTDVISATVTC